MELSIEPTTATKNLMAQIMASAPRVVADAKYKALTQASIVFSTKSKQEAPIDSGNLRRNIQYKVESDGSEAKVLVDPSIEYAIYQEMGTGLFGPYHRMITPKNGKFLRFKVKSGAIVFARQVKGVKAYWYMKKGSEYLLTKQNEIDQILYNELVKGLMI